MIFITNEEEHSELEYYLRSRKALANSLVKSIERMNLTLQPMQEFTEEVQRMNERMTRPFRTMETIQENLENMNRTMENLSNLILDNPNIYHYREVRDAYQNNSNSVVIILLSVFFRIHHHPSYY